MTNTHTSRVAQLVFIALLTTALLATSGCGRKKEQLRPRRHSVNVAVTPIEPIAQYRDMIRLNGSTEPDREVIVAAEVAGAVEEIAVRKGQHVNAGELLVRLNTDLLQAEVDRYQAEADFRQRECEKLRDLRGRGVATEYEVEQAEAVYANAKALCELALARLERSTIEAPIDGVIDSLPVEIGEYLQPGTPVASIADVEIISVVVYVPERDISYLQVGKPAMVVAEQRGQAEQFLGEISFISKVADPVTFTTRVQIDIDNSQGQLRSGEIVDVYLERQVLTDIIMIPLETAIPRERDYVVYIVEPVAEMVVYLPAKAFGETPTDTPVILRLLDETPSTELVGTIQAIHPSLEDSRRVEMILKIGDPDRILVDGTNAEILIGDHPAETVSIASLGDEASASNLPNPVAWRCYRAARRVVTLNMSQIHETQVMVSEGLEPGMWLIIKGQQYVGPGEAVILRQPVDAPPLPASDQRQAEDQRLQGEYYQHPLTDTESAAAKTIED